MLYTDGCLDYRNGALHHVKLHKSKRRWKDSGIENVLNNLPVKFTITDAKRGSFGSTMRTISFLGESRSYLENLIGQKSTIHPNFFRMNQRQARLFLKTWALFDGDENKMLLQCDNETIVEQIQHIAVLAGWTSHLVFKKLVSGKETTYVKIKQIRDVKPSNRYEVDYDGIVWCPNTDDGTAVFMKEGNVFISGNSQAPFSNITLDWVCPNDLKDIPAIVAGEPQEFTYGECQAEMDRVNKIFMEIMLEGDANGRGFQYPIPTYNITKEFNWDHPNAELLFSMTAKYGTPYFANFLNSDLNPEDIRSMCCRLSLDKRELRKRGGGLFGSDEFTGSIGVVTINLPQLAYKSSLISGTLEEKADHFCGLLTDAMNLAKDSLEIKREKLTEWFNAGLYPYTKRYLSGFQNHFNTIGLVGMNEACLNLLGKDITTREGALFAEHTLLYMRERLQEYQLETGNLYNLEATPAESTSYRLAKHDKKNFPGIITSGDTEPYYTNSSQLPVDFTSDIFEALDKQDPLQKLYTGGTVFHTMLGEKISSWESCRALVKVICTKYHIPYVSISPKYSICADHGYLTGEQQTCPHCGKETEVYARIVGYYRAIKNWNAGKQEEKKHRRDFIIKST
jgi:anaerobic ribonucleoside-triphosphate reductase